MTRRLTICALLLIPAFLAGPVLMTSESLATTVTIVNGDGAGEGFNDPAPRAPVGGNPGVTLGQQRLIAFQFAADIWGATLDSNVEIRVLATFDALACNATSAVLGSAGTIFIFADFGSTGFFPGPVAPNTWHHSALADKRAGGELNPGQADIRARFNTNLGNVGCLTGIGWYYGLDNNHGTQIDLVAVVLHELAHGLGFQQFANTATGSQINGLTDVYGVHLLDLTTGKTWDQMTDAERVASAINSRKVVWNGAEVTAAVPSVLQAGTPFLSVASPPSVAGAYAVGTAAFGSPLSSPGVTGELALVADGVASTTDACEPLTNAPAIAGKIAVLDRGTCGFVVKVKNAQDAGAIAAIVVDNLAGGPPPGMGGVDPTITIPSVRVTLADGNALKAAMLGGPVVATLELDLSLRAGADAAGRALMNAPNPLQPGSSISHWDPLMSPNQLMEPAYNGDVTHVVVPPTDLSKPLMLDIGWYDDHDLDGIADAADCQSNSDFETTVSYKGCDTGVPNTLFSTGCTMRDLIDLAAASSENHGQLMSQVAQLADGWLADGLITAAQKDAIVSCVARSVRASKPPKPPTSEESRPVAGEFSLGFAGANPSRNGTRLEFTLPASSQVGVSIHDIRGALVWRTEPRSYPAGSHVIEWNGMNARGELAAAGVYFVKFAYSGNVAQRRFVIVR